MGIIVQAFKDYYTVYITDGNSITQYTGEDILYKYKDSDDKYDPAIVRIFDATAEIHPDIWKYSRMWYCSHTGIFSNK